MLSELREQYLLTWKVRPVGVRILPKISTFVLNSVKVGKKAYGTKGLIETHLASKSSPPTIDNSMDHVTRFVSRYSLIYGYSYHTGNAVQVNKRRRDEFVGICTCNNIASVTPA